MKKYISLLIIIIVAFTIPTLLFAQSGTYAPAASGTGWAVKDSCTSTTKLGSGCVTKSTAALCIGNGTSCVAVGGGAQGAQGAQGIPGPAGAGVDASSIIAYTNDGAGCGAVIWMCDRRRLWAS